MEKVRHRAGALTFLVLTFYANGYIEINLQGSTHTRTLISLLLSRTTLPLSVMTDKKS